MAPGRRQARSNAIAQSKITLTPTPMATPTTVPVTPTAKPVPADDSSPTPTPDWPRPTADNPLAGYVQSSVLQDPWLELALPQGRWDVLVPACDNAPSTWSNVWLLTSNAGRLQLVKPRRAVGRRL